MGFNVAFKPRISEYNRVGIYKCFKAVQTIHTSSLFFLFFIFLA
jgi:hypothetical protein